MQAVNVLYNPASSTGYTVTPDQPALVAALDAIHHWRKKEELVGFALARHGYCDTDGFFGITYSGDLDDYDRQVLGESIPEGFVQAIAWYGGHHGPSYLLEEETYLDLLCQYFIAYGRNDLARPVSHRPETQPPAG